MSTATLELPEMILRAPAVVPPMVLSLAYSILTSMSFPSELPLASIDVEPVASRPM